MKYVELETAIEIAEKYGSDIVAGIYDGLDGAIDVSYLMKLASRDINEIIAKRDEVTKL